MVRSSLHLILNRDARTMQYPRRSYSYSNSNSLMERSQHSSYSLTASVPQESQQDWNNKNLSSPPTTPTPAATTTMNPTRNKTKKTKKKIVIVEMDGLLFCKDEHADEPSSANVNDDEDNESDVSSLDSYGSVTSDYHRRHELKQRQQGQERRTIFQKHWEMKRRISEATSATMDSTVAFSNNSILLTLQHQQQQQQQSFSNRRSLFPKYATSSMPTFMTPPATTSERVRKTNSTSALLNRRRPSSILRGLDSNSSHKNNNTNNILSSSSVTFDPKVSIFEFEQPSEFYDPRDWYKFFH